MFKRILVAVDGSKLAGDVARLAAKLASAAGAGLVLVR